METLVEKTMRTAGKCMPKSIILAGGVAANAQLRDRLKTATEDRGMTMHLPPFQYSLDNAAMIGAAGYFRAVRGMSADPLMLVVDPNMDI